MYSLILVFKLKKLKKIFKGLGLIECVIDGKLVAEIQNY